MHDHPMAGGLETSAGEPRGTIEPGRLTELWFHTGTVCNLACPFCLEGSRPGDDRIQRLAFEDARPFFEEALDLGVEQFAFTGGEPFVARDLLRMLDHALDHRPCLVLTNGTRPLTRRMRGLTALRAKPHPLRFRVSLDHPDPARHDAARGPGSFARALATAAALHRRGFAVSIARHAARGEDPAAVDRAYRPHFAEAGLPADTRLHPFPELHPPGAHPDVPEITEHCLTTYHTEETRRRFMCHYTRFVLKREGRVRVYACTLVDDDPAFDLGGTLGEAMQHRVVLRHHRCFSCFALGATCSEG